METKVSTVVRNIKPSLIRAMSAKAARYDNVISLGIGEPDFRTPKEICSKALEDAIEGATRYVPSQGDPELLSTLRDHLKEKNGYPAATDNLIITGGGMGALTAFFRTVLNENDEVLLPEPHFPAYTPEIQFAGGRVVHVPTSFNQGFRLTVDAVERALTPRSKVLVLSYPNNPTGATVSGELLDGLAKLVLERDLLVVSDEVYDRMVYDGAGHESIATRPHMRERTCVIGSFSKSFAMTGWRVGWAVGPDWLIKEMNKVVNFYTACGASVSQRAALAALNHDTSFFDAMIEKFKQRRNLISETLADLPGIRVHPPGGTFYIFPNIGSVMTDTEQFALDLLDEQQVVVIPGTAFGPSGADCVRMSFAVEQSRLEEALDRFSRFIKKRL